jgi:hypothetical protein
MLRSEELSLGKLSIPEALDEAYNSIYNHIRSDNFKKTDFAMSILAGPSSWQVPNYIANGLQWLKKRLCHSIDAPSQTD